MTDSNTPKVEFQSYSDIIWGQFKRYPLSYWSMWGVIALFAIAIFSPVFALNVPFYVSVPETANPDLAGASFPWFKALFDRNVFVSGVDIFFNYLLFATPVILILWFFYKKSISSLDSKSYKTKRLNFIWAALAAIAICFLILYFAFDYGLPYVDYVELAKKDGVSAIFPPIEYSYRLPNLEETAQSVSSQHWFGTDNQGRDVFTRILFGTRISLTIGVVAVSIYVSIGVLLGAIAGYYGGWIDSAILRMVEVMICFPTFFLILTLRGFINEPSIFHIMLIIGLTGWTSVARLVRAEFLRLREGDFVQAAIAQGLTEKRIIFRHVLPNALGPVLVSAAFGIAGAILIEASLSFLGLGVPGAPSWGQVLASGRGTGQHMLILAPGFAIFITVTLLNLVGEGARDALDPKLRK